jgi:hypothetical protein
LFNFCFLFLCKYKYLDYASRMFHIVRASSDEFLVRGHSHPALFCFQLLTKIWAKHPPFHLHITMSSGSSKSLKKDRLVVSFSLEPRSQWYDYPPIPESATTVPAPSPTQLSDLLARAASLYSSAVESYQSKHEKASSKDSSSLEAGFLSNIAQSGTLSDRLSALTLMVQSSPVHNAKALETLKGMVERGKGKGGREESLKALRCIVDWWVGGGAPGRKLRYVDVFIFAATLFEVSNI